MVRFYLLCMFLCAVFLTKAQDQEILEAISFEKKYFETQDPSFLLEKAYVYKRLGDLDHALATLERINSPDSLIESSTLYERTLLHFLKEEYQEAQNSLLRYRFFGYPEDKNLLIIEVLCQINLQELDMAKKLMMKHQEDLGIDSMMISTIIPEDLKLKEPAKARRISYFVPGVGQMYAGYFGKGLISGGANLVAIAFTGYSLYTGYFFTGVMTGAAVFYTFYLGGARYAYQLSERKNLEIIKEVENQFKTELN